MALAGRVETTLDLKCSAEDFYKTWKTEPHKVPGHTPTNLQAVELHDDTWDNHGHGSVKTWSYTCEGKTEYFKEKVELDDEEMSATLVGVDGQAMKMYKYYKPVYKVTPKPTGGSLATLSIDYEKLDPSVRDPQMYLDMMASITKDIDAALSG